MQIVSMTNTGLRIDECVAYARFSFIPNVTKIIANDKQIVNEAVLYFEHRPLTLYVPKWVYPKHISFTEDMFLVDESYLSKMCYNNEPTFLDVFSVERLSSSYRVTPMFDAKPFLCDDVKNGCFELITKLKDDFKQRIIQ